MALGKKLPGKGTAKTGEAPRKPEEIEEERQDALRALIVRFIEDYALLISGADCAFDYVDAVVANRLRRAVEPFLASGDRMRPNFEDYAHANLSGDLSDPRIEPNATVSFRDRSQRVRKNKNERAPDSPVRDVQMRLYFSADVTTITGIHVQATAVA